MIELSQQGLTQLAMADEVGVSAGTVARWLTAPGFPERSIRSDRHRDRARFLQTERGLQAPASKTHYSSGRIAGLLMKPEGLSAEQKGHVNAFLQFCPKARHLRRLALQFPAMLRWRKDRRLKTWMEKATASGFRFLKQFARALRRDLDAVKLALTTRWSNGPLEGHIID